MKIDILDDYQNAVPSLSCFARLAGHDVTVWNDHASDPAELAARLHDTQILVLIRERTPMTAGLLAQLPHLELISQYGATPHIDLAACDRLGITVCSGQSARPSWATAEFTWGLILAALRHIPQEVAHMKQGRWQSTIGDVLHGRTLGVFGYGRIGALLAQYGKAFGMRVVVWGRESTQDKARADGVAAAAGRQAFFEEADVLSLHLRLTDATRGIVTANDLARMRPTALLVNTSRAELIATGALAAALLAGRPGRAAVDVYEEEPVTEGRHPLLALDNALCTPHLGHVEREAYEFGFGKAFEQILSYLGGRPENVLNPGAAGASRRPDRSPPNAV